MFTSLSEIFDVVFHFSSLAASSDAENAFTRVQQIVVEQSRSVECQETRRVRGKYTYLFGITNDETGDRGEVDVVRMYFSHFHFHTCNT